MSTLMMRRRALEMAVAVTIPTRGMACIQQCSISCSSQTWCSLPGLLNAGQAALVVVQSPDSQAAAMLGWAYLLQEHICKGEAGSAGQGKADQLAVVRAQLQEDVTTRICTGVTRA